MDSSIHLHFSSKINSLEFSEDDLGRYKIPLLSRQSLSRKGLGVAVVKLDKFIESFLISNYINNGRSDIQMSGNIEQQVQIYVTFEPNKYPIIGTSVTYIIIYSAFGMF